MDHMYQVCKNGFSKWVDKVKWLPNQLDLDGQFLRIFWVGNPYKKFALGGNFPVHAHRRKIHTNSKETVEKKMVKGVSAS